MDRHAGESDCRYDLSHFISRKANCQKAMLMRNVGMNIALSEVECTIPIVPVKGSRTKPLRSIQKRWGSNSDWGGARAGSCICSVSKDGHCLMLLKRDSIAEPVWVWIGLEDDSLFETYRSRGVKVRQEPKNFSWAYEMKFEDLDGNVLWLGTESRKDEPVEDQKPA